MKKILVLSILGLAATAASSYGQGGIVFNNGPAGGPYVPIVWDDGASSLLGRPSPVGGVRSTDPVTITLWYALQGQSLTPHNSVVWNSGFESSGFYGYYTVQADLAGWSAGQTWEFQLRAAGPNGVSGQSVVWTENANILFTGGVPAGPPGQSVNRIGFTVFVPEPSTFALLGLGALALVNYRRRNA